MSEAPAPPWAPLGDDGIRWARDGSRTPAEILAALRGRPAVRDVVVTERHVAVFFDLERGPDGAVITPVARAPWRWLRDPQSPRPAAPRVITIRARYDGPDLAELAERAGITKSAAVKLHTGRPYTVAMLGFLPGFAYLREVEPHLAAPRRDRPRERIPAGAIGVAGAYTGVYPFASPGGWHIIGSAVDFSPFDPVSGSTLRAGDEVRFVQDE
jgi:UPF0271 protein